jgi:hypothetical protein
MDIEGHMKQRKKDVGLGQETAAGFVAPDPEQLLPYEEVARRAHEIYLARGGGEGSAVEDWLRAERELLREREKRG